MLDNEPDTLDALCTVLTMAGATVECFSDPARALGGVDVFGPHVLVCDLYMPGMDGWTFIEQLRARGLGIPAVALTAHPSVANQERAVACGYAACLGKPIHPEELVGVLSTVAEAHRGPAMGASRGSFATTDRCEACQAQYLVVGETRPGIAPVGPGGTKFVFRCGKCWADVRVTLPGAADLERVSVHRQGG
jgi:CheY-like chemotaxis protein